MITSRKILVLGTYLEDKTGGIRSYSHQIINSLKDENKVLALSLYDKKNNKNFNHKVCKGNFFKFFFLIIYYYFKFDRIIWTHASLSIFFLPFSFFYNQKNYLMIHGVEIWGPNVNKLRIFMCSRFNNFVGPSKFTTDKVRKYYKSNFKKYYYLHCTSSIRSSDNKNNNYINPYDDRFINILSVSRIEGLILNNIYIMLKALSKIKSKKIRFHIIGEGDSSIIEEKIKEYGIEDRVFLYNYVENLNKYYAFADYLSHITDWAGLGVVNMEAFSLGTPVIVSKNSGSSEIVFENLNGHKITNDQSTDELTNLLENISNSKFDIKFLKSESKRIYDEKYSEMQFNNYSKKIFVRPKILLFYKNLVQTGGAENLLLNSYYQFSKKYFTEIITYENNLFFNIKIKALNSFYPLIKYFYYNRHNSIIIGSSGIVDLFIIGIIFFKRYYYHVHQPILFSYNETDKYAYKNLIKIKHLYSNPNLYKFYYEYYRSLNILNKMIINLRFIIRKIALKYAKKIFVLSELAKDEKKIVYNINSEILRGGIEDTLIKNFDFETNVFDSKFINIVSISRLVNDKRVLKVIKAINNSNNRNIRLYVYGVGPEENLIKDYVNKYNLHNNIFLTGYLSELDKFKVISSADFLISIGAADFNLTAVEALYFKTCVILSDEFFYSDRLLNKKAIKYISISQSKLEKYFSNLKVSDLSKEEWEAIQLYIKKSLSWHSFYLRLEKMIN